jgi:hypothetical protein
MCFFKTQGEKKCKKKTLALKMLCLEDNRLQLLLGPLGFFLRRRCLLGCDCSSDAELTLLFPHKNSEMPQKGHG